MESYRDEDKVKENLKSYLKPYLERLEKAKEEAKKHELYIDESFRHSPAKAIDYRHSFEDYIYENWCVILPYTEYIEGLDDIAYELKKVCASAEGSAMDNIFLYGKDVKEEMSDEDINRCKDTFFARVAWGLAYHKRLDVYPKLVYYLGVYEYKMSYDDLDKSLARIIYGHHPRTYSRTWSLPSSSL